MLRHVNYQDYMHDSIKYMYPYPDFRNNMLINATSEVFKSS